MNQILRGLYNAQGERLKLAPEYECYSCGKHFPADDLKDVWRAQGGEWDCIQLCFRCEKIKDWSRP